MKAEPLSQVIDRVVNLLASQLRKKNITLTVTGWEEGKSLLVAGEKLSQVFLNIILNAIDAAPTRGEIVVETRKNETGCTVAVKDNGPGIPGDLKARIFDTFYSTKEGGTGLGLSISKKIVESYGGTITLSDADLDGACFTIFLPAQNSGGKANNRTESTYKNIKDNI